MLLNFRLSNESNATVRWIPCSYCTVAVRDAVLAAVSLPLDLNDHPLFPEKQQNLLDHCQTALLPKKKNFFQSYVILSLKQTQPFAQLFQIPATDNRLMQLC